MSEMIDYFNLFTKSEIDNKSNDIKTKDFENTKTEHNTDELPNNTYHNEMPALAKKTLVYLMRQGVILQSQKPQVFANVLQYKEIIIRHLSEVYLSLIIDERQGVLFVARSDYQENQEDDNEINDEMSDEEDISSLISRRVISVYDSLLLLLLRKYYQERENAGEQQIIIDIDKLEGLLSPFLPLTNYESKGKKQLLSRINGLLKPHKIVQSIRNSDERFEITPMIRYVVNADFLTSMLSEYEALLQKSQNPTNELNDANNGKKSKKAQKSNTEQSGLF